MRLNHLDLHVPDVDATVAFFTRYLGLTLVDMRGRSALAILGDGHGLELVISLPVEKLGAADQVDRPVSYHIGFIVDDRADVDRIFASMQADGLNVQAPREMRGGWLFYYQAPGNVLVEIGARALLA